MITVETDMGKITISKSVIGNIVMDVVASFDGKVILSDSKGRVHKFILKLGPKEESDNIQVEKTADGIDLRVFVVLRFGAGIRKTTAQLIEALRTEIKEGCGIDANNISIVITGMISKKIAPRHIEVTG